jgi:hypothetical protein
MARFINVLNVQSLIGQILHVWAGGEVEINRGFMHIELTRTQGEKRDSESPMTGTRAGFGSVTG